MSEDTESLLQVVVLSDINMSGMNGFEFVRRIREYERRSKKEPAFFAGVTGFVD